MLRDRGECLARQCMLADLRKCQSKAEVGAKEIVSFDIWSAQSGVEILNRTAKVVVSQEGVLTMSDAIPIGSATDVKGISKLTNPNRVTSETDGSDFLT